MSDVWLENARKNALETYARLGLPTTRDEAWRYTSLAPLAKRLSETRSSPGEVDASFGDIPGNRLVFVDGRFVPARSRLDSGHGLTLSSLAERLEHDPQALEIHLAGLADSLDNGLHALNAALFTDGALIRIPRKTQLAEPIQLIFASSPGSTSHIRNRIVVDADASVDLLEVHIGAEGSVSESITDVVLGPGASLRYTRVQDQGAAHLGRVEVRHHENSKLAATQIILGGDVQRVEVAVHLADHAEARLSGLSLVSGERTADHFTLVRHGSNRGTSEQLYKAIVADQGTSTFYGKVKVEKDTASNDARQSSKNLLLSPRATANTRPELEIDSQDVKCSHGATVGRLDESHVFYLRSRGIGESEARALLTAAFAEEILERIGSDAVRTALAPRLRAAIGGLIR